MDPYNYDVNNGAAAYDSYGRPLQRNVGYYQGRAGYSYDPTQQAYLGQGHGNSYDPTKEPCKMDKGRRSSYGPTQQSHVGQAQGMNYYPGNGSSFHVEVREKVSTYAVRNQHPPADCSYYNTDRSMPSMPGSHLNGAGSQYTMHGSQYNMDGSHSSGYGQVQYSAVNCPSSSSAGYRLPCDPHLSNLESNHPIQQNFVSNAISDNHAWNGNSGNDGMMGSGIGAPGRNGCADGSGWNRPTDATSFCSTSTQLVPSTLNQQRPLVENLSIASTMHPNQQAASDGNPSEQKTPGNIFVFL